MKKVIIPLVLFLIVGYSAQAQYVSYGAKLGLSFPGLQDERIASERITPAFHLIGNVHLSRTFLFQMEFGYELKGNKFTYEPWDPITGNVMLDSVYEQKTNMGYITVPLFVKYNIGRSNKFYAQLGGYYGYLLHASFSGMMNEELVSKVAIKQGLAPHDFGIVVGGGLETPVRRGLSMLLDVKYNLGMNNLNADPAIIGHSNPIKTKNFIMSMGVIIDIE